MESEQGSGTTFHIYIPASHEEPARRENGPDGPIPGRGHILVMDDEDLVREVSVKMLQRLGFRVATASSGQEALDLYSSALRSGNRFDAVIMDLTIPGGMGGQELVSRLLEIDPGTRAIVASGYSNDPVLADYRNFGFRGIIAKPFSIAELSDSLHRVMED